MSRESYARGFVKAVKSKGLDPKALMAYIKESPYGGEYNLDIGLGPLSENGLYLDGNRIRAIKPSSYFGRLVSNLKSRDVRNNEAADGLGAAAFKGSKRRYLEELGEYASGHYPAGDRFVGSDNQATVNTDRIVPDSGERVSDDWIKIRENLYRAGLINYINYIKSGKVPKRKKIDTTGIEGVVLDKNKARLLLEMQNTAI